MKELAALLAFHRSANPAISAVPGGLGMSLPKADPGPTSISADRKKQMGNQGFSTEAMRVGRAEVPQKPLRPQAANAQGFRIEHGDQIEPVELGCDKHVVLQPDRYQALSGRTFA